MRSLKWLHLWCSRFWHSIILSVSSLNYYILQDIFVYLHLYIIIFSSIDEKDIASENCFVKVIEHNSEFHFCCKNGQIYK